MRLLCIKGTSPDEVITNGLRKGQKPAHSELIFDGDEYNAIRVLHAEGKDWYVLVDKGPKVGYGVERFIPLDGPDEVEMMEARYEAEGALLDAEYENIGKMTPEPLEMPQDRFERIFQKATAGIQFNS